jgi:DNA-binding XRE family transcriptional regulator
MDDSEGTRTLRRDLGRALKEARRAAGYSQAQLARKTGYARSTVSTVESGCQNVPRIFWERSDAALGSGTALLARYDRLAQQRLAGLSRTAAGAWAREDTRHVRRGLGADIASDAVAAYMRLGWKVHDGDGRVDLVCGNGIEALEVPRPTGVVAVQWWLHTGGAPDEIRRLPALPGPQDALAVIAAGDRYLFLVQAGACPWADPDLAVAPQAGGPRGWRCAGMPTAAGSRPRPRWMVTGGVWRGRTRRRTGCGSPTRSCCLTCLPGPPR